MLSLLKKDFNVLTKQYKMYVILLVFFLFAGSVSTTDEFFSTFPLVVCSWFTASLIAYDEKQGEYPQSRRLYVLEKYLFQLSLAALSLIICVAGLSKRYGVGSPEFCNVLLVMLIAALLVPAVMLPIIFKNGAQKSVLKYLAVLVVGVACCYYISAAFEAEYIVPMSLGVCVGAAVVFAVILFFSFRLSVKYFEKREI